MPSVVINLSEEQIEVIRKRYGSVQRAMVSLLGYQHQSRLLQPTDSAIPEKYRECWEALKVKSGNNGKISLFGAIGVIVRTRGVSRGTARKYLRQLVEDFGLLEIDEPGAILRVKK